MIFELIAEVAKLALAVAGLYFTIGVYVRSGQASWAGPLERRRLTMLLLLILGATAAKVSEDVLGGESGPIDRTILLFIHAHVARELNGYFEAVTFTGSSKFLFPLTIVIAAALLYARRRFEAMLLVASVAGSAAIVYAVKALVGRARPALWNTEAYWGSSFPSGHTLAVAAFATAAVIGLTRIWPSARKPALPVAILWIGLVAMSRLVLGVHWPSDVLVAACIGVFLPLAMSVALALRRA